MRQSLTFLARICGSFKPGAQAHPDPGQSVDADAMLPLHPTLQRTYNVIERAKEHLLVELATEESKGPTDAAASYQRDYQFCERMQANLRSLRPATDRDYARFLMKSLEQGYKIDTLGKYHEPLFCAEKSMILPPGWGAASYNVLVAKSATVKTCDIDDCARTLDGGVQDVRGIATRVDDTAGFGHGVRLFMKDGSIDSRYQHRDLTPEIADEMLAMGWKFKPTDLTRAVYQQLKSVHWNAEGASDLFSSGQELIQTVRAILPSNRSSSTAVSQLSG